jgi:hypothetical protein
MPDQAVVADSGPLIALAIVRCLHLLRDLYGSPIEDVKEAVRASEGISAQRGRRDPLRARRECQATIESIMDGRMEISLIFQNDGARPVMDVPR